MVRGLLAAAVLALVASFGFAVAAGFPVVADDVTVVRIPGAVPEKRCTVAPVADAYVDEALPETPFGDEDFLAVASGPANRRALVRFDLGSCSVPAGAELRSARLTMVVAAAPAQARTWDVRRVTSVWHAATVTWTTAPTVAATVTDTAPIGTIDGATVAWDVRTDVADVVSGGATDRGWRIADVSEGAPLRVGGALASSETATSDARPSLTLTWFD